MEFGRWGLDKITEFFSEVLEGEHDFLNESQGASRSAFQASDDYSKLRNGRGHSRFEVFRDLAPYYEAGFLLSPAGAGGVFLDAMFLAGNVYQPAQDERPLVGMTFPNFSDRRVFSGRMPAVLRAFGLERCENLKDATPFLFRPAPGFVVLLVCNRPGPWQTLAIENAHDAISSRLERRTEGTA